MSGETITTAVVKGASTRYVKLNVGGTVFLTTIGTLTKKPDSMLGAMFSGRMEVLTDTEGWVLIDRSGKHFQTILNYLRDGAVSLPENKQELEELLAEVKYYLLEELASEVMETLHKRHETLEPICRIPLITSPKEEKMLVSYANRPVIKLLCNRYNNKYSYTGQSDDNLLKNLELFDKLSLRFNGRIMFIKDVIANDEICCWSFYGNGKKVCEVCCTSIVYATERKQTKVEFPEARIYEETLNVLLYEKCGEKPLDAELLRATRRIRDRDRERGEENDEVGSLRRQRLHALAAES